MCPKTSHQFEDIRKEKRKLILDSALKVFAIKGYHGASIANIAGEAGISKGLIYNYFSSKEIILKETISAGLKSMFEQYHFETENYSLEQFSKLIDITFDLLEADYDYWKIYFSVLMQTDVMELIKDRLMETLMPVIQNFTQLFEKLGYAKPYEEARFLGSILDGLSINYIIDPENFPKEYCVQRLKTIYKLP